MQFCRVDQLFCMLTCLFWGAVDSFAGLFNGFYCMCTGESTSKADNFDNLRLIKILSTPLTQKGPGIHTKKPEEEQNLQTKKCAISRPCRMNFWSGNCSINACQQDGFWDKKSSDFSGEIFRERIFCPRTAFSGKKCRSILSNQVISWYGSRPVGCWLPTREGIYYQNVFSSWKTPRFLTLLFGKEAVKTFFYKFSNLGIYESTSINGNKVVDK